uniref:Retrovirus-related Pol polyprotein from transposon TNT 1-94 n=2 Tax=Loa loa TaxID=7209 RepID=A0A1I7V5L7_LOALO
MHKEVPTVHEKIPAAKAFDSDHSSLYLIGYTIAHNRLRATKKCTKSDPNHAPFTNTPISRMEKIVDDDNVGGFLN